MSAEARLRVRVWVHEGALPSPVGHRALRAHARASVLVRVDDGCSAGLGEATPLPGFSPDTLAECEGVLRAIERTLGPAGEHPSAEALLETVLAPADALLARTPAARFAIETALRNLRSDLPLREGETPAWTARGPVSRCALLGGGAVDPAGWPALARAILTDGHIENIRAVKVKVGRADLPFARELSALRALREVLPATVELRADANGAWALADARDRVRALAENGVDRVEEPCAGMDLLRLGPCAIPWLADESLVEREFMTHVFDAPGCGGLVLKPAIVGGVRACLRLQRAASVRGLRCALSHVFDGPIALRMAHELAMRAPVEPLASAVGWHEGLAVFPRVEREGARDEGPWSPYAHRPEDWAERAGS